MLTLFCNTVWMLLHLIVCFYEVLHWLSSRFHAATLWSYDLCQSRGNLAISTQRELKLLQHCKSQLTKIPRHISIIVGPDDTTVNVNLLSRIFNYALIMDISYVSYYDTRRDFSPNFVPIEDVQVPGGIYSTQISKQVFRWTPSIQNKMYKENDICCTLTKNDANNGNVQHIAELDKFVEIHEITSQDGRPLLADVCINLFKQRCNESFQLLLNQDRSKLSDCINTEVLQLLHKLPDPEISIIFNWQTCSYGVLPWHTRFTEFQRLDSCSYFNADKFSKLLYRYSRCQQRWGK